MDAMLRRALRKYSDLRQQVEAMLLGDDGDEVERQLKNFVAKRECWVKKTAKKATKTTVAIWRKIKLGTGLKTTDDFRNALKKGGFKLGDWGNDILGKEAFTKSISPTEMEVELVVKSVAELSFTGGATRADIYKKAIELGLDLCPAEVGPQLRLQYLDQPKGEWLIIAMEPIVDSVGCLRLFFVERDAAGLWLHGNLGYPDYFLHAASRFVFCRKKP